MRLPYRFILSILIICTSQSLVGQGQYPEGCFNPQYVACYYAGCLSSYFTGVRTANGGSSYSWTLKPCCGQQYWVPLAYQGTCFSAELKTPEIEKRLLERAQKTEVLVASCDGYIRPLPHVVFTEKPIPPRSFWDRQIHLPNLTVTSGERPK
jgi:hypothetical protein